MSCPSKFRKPLKAFDNSKSKNNNSNSSSSTGNSSSNSINAVGSKVCNKKVDQKLSSTVNSSVGSSTADFICDVSAIEKPNVKNEIKCHKEHDKEAKKAVAQSKALKFPDRAEIAYANYIQKLYFHSLLTRRIKSESEICFSDLEAEKLKLQNDISTVKKWLKEVSSMQENEARIEQLENIFREAEGGLHQLQAMLERANLNMKMASCEIPLRVLKVTDTSRDEFLSSIQELSNIRNEIISIMKPHQDGQKSAARNLDTCISTARELQSLIKECCSVWPSVERSYCRLLSLQICQTHQDLQLDKIGFQLYPEDQLVMQ